MAAEAPLIRAVAVAEEVLVPALPSGAPEPTVQLELVAVVATMVASAAVLIAAFPVEAAVEVEAVKHLVSVMEAEAAEEPGHQTPM